ncbi:MAG: hypothetical protein R3A44_42300 [Caldilineaceae bacterium]
MSYKLSVEELGFLMGYLGESAAAAGYLTSIIGAQAEENLTGRITAASHSLVARGLLRIGASAAETSLEPELAAFVQTIIAASASLRCEKLQGAEEDVLTIFLGPERRIAHNITNLVIANLDDVTAHGVTGRRVVEFIAPPHTESAPTAEPVGTMTLPNLEAMREQIEQKKFDAAATLLAQHVDAPIASEIVQTLSSDMVTWGSILLLETVDRTTETPLETNTGILYARTPAMLWLFSLHNDETVTIHCGSAAIIEPLVQSLIG